MKQSKSKVVGCRLSHDLINQAEKIAAAEGDTNVNALVKRLLLERVAKITKPVPQPDYGDEKCQGFGDDVFFASVRSNGQQRNVSLGDNAA